MLPRNGGSVLVSGCDGHLERLAVSFVGDAVGGRHGHVGRARRAAGAESCNTPF